ncbi:MAG: hypothetical protein KDE27_11665 [Planctomycetes bacterium]|nr:hypothetical protein [Planctomycetota bacterium]
MNAPTVLASVVLASGAAAAITLFAHPEATPAPDPALAEAQAQVAALQQQVHDLESRLTEVATARSVVAAPAGDRVEVPTLSREQIAIAVESYLKERGKRAADATASGDGEPLTPEALFATVDGKSFFENQDAWRAAFEAGRMDELIDMFEEAADNNPQDVDKQMALANAYMAYLQLDNTKYQFASKADLQYDKVLELNPRHWEARFTKAMSYTFWPKFLGKDREAIQHFETLVEQQESMPVQDHQAQTYLFLGNLLQEKDPERAKQIWAQGMSRHPTNEELRKKLGQ